MQSTTQLRKKRSKSTRVSSKTKLIYQEKDDSMNNKSIQIKIWIIASKII